MFNRLMLVIGAALIAANASIALAQDPPATRTNVPNEAAEPPMQKIGSGGMGGGVPSGPMRKMAAPTGPGGFYGLLDVRHTLNDYFDISGNRLRRDPAVHAKLRLGGKFYGETLDVSFGMGGAKLPASQRAYQKRPDVTIDMYPVKGRVLNILVYVNALFPVRSTDLDPTEFADGDRYDLDYRRSIDATVMSVGVAPNIKLEGAFGVGRIYTLVGADAWTRMYSKPIYISEKDSSRSIGLLDEDAPFVEKPFEDRAMRYVHQETAALGYSPSFLTKLQTEIAGYSESRFMPRYSQNKETGTWDYVYEPERISFTRFKLAVDLSPSVNLSNELYYFRNGFFAEDRVGQQRRYRNIVRLAMKM